MKMVLSKELLKKYSGLKKIRREIKIELITNKSELNRLTKLRRNLEKRLKILKDYPEKKIVVEIHKSNITDINLLL